MKNLVLETNYAKYPYNYSLIARVRQDNEDCYLETYEYVVAWDYDEEKDTWGQGHYFTKLEDALSYYLMKNERVSITRLEQICTQALHYIHEELDLRDFEDNYDIDFSDDELMYFGFADLI